MALTGCTPIPDARSQEVPPPVAGAGACDAGKAVFVVGRAYDDALAASARDASGAKVLRAIRPGTMVTMDYRADRLNLDLDRDGKITKVRCG